MLFPFRISTHGSRLQVCIMLLLSAPSVSAPKIPPPALEFLILLSSTAPLPPPRPCHAPD